MKKLCIGLSVIAVCALLTAGYFYMQAQKSEAARMETEQRQISLEQRLEQSKTENVVLEKELAESRAEAEQWKQRQDTESYNPIDNYFRNGGGDPRTMWDMHRYAWAEMLAWKYELGGLVSWLSTRTEYKEDKNLLEEYYAGVEEEHNLYYDLALLYFNDYPPEERGNLTGSAFGVSGYQTRRYRQAFYMLLSVCSEPAPKLLSYQFSFDETTLEQIRKELDLDQDTADKLLPPIQAQGVD